MVATPALLLAGLRRGETVPEFEQALFNGAYVGVYPQLVKTRYGFHILAVDRREPGRRLPFDASLPRIAQRLRERALQKALQQYVRVLGAGAEFEGVDLDAAKSPLLQQRYPSQVREHLIQIKGAGGIVVSIA